MFRTALAGACAVALVALTALGGCAASPEAETTDGETAALDAMTPDEIVGEMHYGESRSVAYSATPRYRAFWFDGVKGDWINVTVASSTGSIRAWVTDDAFNPQRDGAVSALRKTGRFYIVVREGNLADATLTVDLQRHPLPTH